MDFCSIVFFCSERVIFRGTRDPVTMRLMLMLTESGVLRLCANRETRDCDRVQARADPIPGIRHGSSRAMTDPPPL